MPRRVRVLTDSTSYLPSSLLSSLDIGVIPLQVSIQGETGAEGVVVAPSDVAAALSAKTAVSTSLPTPASVTAALTSAAAGDHDVCLIHLSSELSGTCAASEAIAARLASDLGARIVVIDSRQVAMGLGFVVLAAARRAAEGGSLDDVISAASAAMADTQVLFLVDTLEHLRRGGRLSASQAILGSALAIKPILEVRDGEVMAKEKVRTAGRALARLEQLVVERAAGRPVRLAVHHLAAPEAAAALASRLQEALQLLEPAVVSEVGAVVGAHAGPGLLGAVVCTS